MAEPTLWTTIAQEIEKDICAQIFRSGTKLPSESEFAHRFGVNRHTVRKALAHLADKDLVWSKRGAGVFVTGVKSSYRLTQRVRFSETIRASGRHPSRDILGVSLQAASPDQARVLGLEDGALVHIFHGVSKIDGHPVALFQSAFDATKFPDLGTQLQEMHSVTQALKACGVDDYRRTSTEITAVVADPVQANHLRIKPGDPLLRTKSINSDLQGRPIERGLTFFTADKVQLIHNDGMSSN
jgi:GntR family phosphonate transport system transcriptional regulator